MAHVSLEYREECYAQGDLLIEITVSVGEEEPCLTLVFNENRALEHWQLGRTVASLPDPKSHYSPMPLLS